jgi:hypothetical protein
MSIITVSHLSLPSGTIPTCGFEVVIILFSARTRDLEFSRIIYSDVIWELLMLKKAILYLILQTHSLKQSPQLVQSSARSSGCCIRKFCFSTNQFSIIYIICVWMCVCVCVCVCVYIYLNARIMKRKGEHI